MAPKRKTVDEVMDRLIATDIGRWTVIGDPVYNKKHFKWRVPCQCECGTERVVAFKSLINGESRSCGCLKRELTSRNNRKPDKDIAVNRIYASYKVQAKKRDIEFNLTKKEFSGLMLQSCFYCGIEPSNQFSAFPAERERPFFYNGVDRLNNALGYQTNNCVPCCAQCNWAKRDMTKEQFENWVKRIYLGLYRKVTDKTPGQMIDELATTVIKCFMAQEDIMNGESDAPETLDAAKRAQELNAKRTKLMRSIDLMLDFGEDTVTEKTYDRG
jgi:hypothetical protein